MADVVIEKQEPCNLELNDQSLQNYVLERIEKLCHECVQHLVEKENFDVSSIDTEIYLNLRYNGTDTGMMCMTETKREHIRQLRADEFRNSFIQKLTWFWKWKRF